VAINGSLGDAYFFARKYDLAIEQYKKTLQMDGFDRASFNFGWAYSFKEMYPEAVAVWQTALRKSGDEEGAAAMAEAFRASGFRGALNSRLDHLLRTAGPRETFGEAMLYSQLGQTNEALASLEKAYAAKSGGMAYIKSSPMFDPIRSDPRFLDLLRRMNFPNSTSVLLSPDEVCAIADHCLGNPRARSDLGMQSIPSQKPFPELLNGHELPDHESRPTRKLVGSNPPAHTLALPSGNLFGLLLAKNRDFTSNPVVGKERLPVICP
jgi:tetratricopeptide (TPR) repeat protein